MWKYVILEKNISDISEIVWSAIVAYADNVKNISNHED